MGLGRLKWARNAGQICSFPGPRSLSPQDRCPARILNSARQTDPARRNPRASRPGTLPRPDEVWPGAVWRGDAAVRVHALRRRAKGLRWVPASEDEHPRAPAPRGDPLRLVPDPPRWAGHLEPAPVSCPRDAHPDFSQATIHRLIHSCVFIYLGRDAVVSFLCSNQISMKVLQQVAKTRVESRSMESDDYSFKWNFWGIMRRAAPGQTLRFYYLNL